MCSCLLSSHESPSAIIILVPVHEYLSPLHNTALNSTTNPTNLTHSTITLFLLVLYLQFIMTFATSMRNDFGKCLLQTQCRSGQIFQKFFLRRLVSIDNIRHHFNSKIGFTLQVSTPCHCRCFHILNGSIIESPYACHPYRYNRVNFLSYTVLVPNPCKAASLSATSVSISPLRTCQSWEWECADRDVPRHR